jgi:hypothetical protein
MRFTKATTLFSAAWTMVCAVFVIGLQIASWLKNGVWDAYPISTYVMASSDELINNQVLANWLLRIPAIVPLLVGAALLVAFYMLITVIEKKYPN